MNEVLMRMRRRNDVVPPSEYLHLLIILERLAQSSYTFAVGTKVNGKITIKLADAGQRMRKVVRRSNYRMTGKSPSLKNGRMMHWESKHEHAAFNILEISPLVKNYSEQPAMLRYNDEDGVSYLHYPDILVELECGIRIFIEIKPKSASNDQELACRTNLLTNLLKPLGYHYLMVLPEQVDSLAYLDNAKHLLLYSKTPMPETVWEKVRRIFLKLDAVQLSELVQLIGHVSAKSWIYQLLISGDLCCDLSLPISGQSLINWHQQGEI